MSPETQAAVIGGVAGGAVGGVFGLLGALLGVAWERALQRRGKVQCRLVWVHSSYSGALRTDPNSPARGGITAGTPEHPSEMYEWDMDYTFRVGFHNEKDIDTAFSNVGGALIGPDGRDFIKLRGVVKGEDRTVDLPAHKWAYHQLALEESVGEDRIEHAKKCDRVRIRARWPNGRVYESKILKFNRPDYTSGVADFQDLDPV